MNIRTVGPAAGIAAIAIGVAAGVFLLRGDKPPDADQTVDVELWEDRQPLGAFTRDDAFERASDILGFAIWDPGDAIPASMRLKTVSTRSLGPPGTDLAGPRYAELWYGVEVTGADEARLIQVELFDQAPTTHVPEEWETESQHLGSMTVTVHSGAKLVTPDAEAAGLPTTILVVRSPGVAEGFNVYAPAGLREQALELTRAFIEAYDAR